MGAESHDGMPRRRFLGGVAILGVSSSIGGGRPATSTPRAPSYPQNDAVRVQSVVGASHGDLARVRELVLEQPALAKASWDWGFGDWETALGAASHTGRREIADFLIAHGARPTIFSAAMMGDLPTVEAFLTFDPGLHALHGPHGISLVRHARAGGEDARHVVDYLVERFGEDEADFGVRGDEAMARRYGGRYAFGGESAFEIVVDVRNDWLMVGAGEQPTSRVLRVGADTFHPTGAPAVRLRFAVVDGRSASLTIEDGPFQGTGHLVSG